MSQMETQKEKKEIIKPGEFGLYTVTPISIPRRCVCCKQKTAGKHVIVLTICTDCIGNPKSDLARLVLEEWKLIK